MRFSDAVDKARQLGVRYRCTHNGGGMTIWFKPGQHLHMYAHWPMGALESNDWEVEDPEYRFTLTQLEHLAERATDTWLLSFGKENSEPKFVAHFIKLLKEAGFHDL